MFKNNDLAKKIEDLKKRGKKIVLCHGVFDLIHIGHINHFKKAKSFGDYLIVSITSAKFIKKGPGRPLFDDYQRFEFLKSIKFIDQVLLSNNASSVDVIKLVKPNIYVKGSDYKVGNWVVYPTHGVGKVMGVENQEIAGTKLRLIVISFEKDRMTLRVPVDKASDSGLRKLSSPEEMKGALKTLKGRSRVRRTMWSRRAQEYEAKINSGDPVSIAEVVRDLHRKEDQPDQSYSERQIYQAALDRLARELAAVEDIDHGLEGLDLRQLALRLLFLLFLLANRRVQLARHSAVVRSCGRAVVRSNSAVGLGRSRRA